MTHTYFSQRARIAFSAPWVTVTAAEVYDLRQFIATICHRACICLVSSFDDIPFHIGT